MRVCVYVRGQGRPLSRVSIKGSGAMIFLRGWFLVCQLEFLDFFVGDEFDRVKELKKFSREFLLVLEKFPLELLEFYGLINVLVEPSKRFMTQTFYHFTAEVQRLCCCCHCN